MFVCPHQGHGLVAFRIGQCLFVLVWHHPKRTPPARSPLALYEGSDIEPHAMVLVECGLDGTSPKQPVTEDVRVNESRMAMGKQKRFPHGICDSIVGVYLLPSSLSSLA